MCDKKTRKSSYTVTITIHAINTLLPDVFLRSLLLVVIGALSLTACSFLPI